MELEGLPVTFQGDYAALHASHNNVAICDDQKVVDVARIKNLLPSKSGERNGLWVT
jgi:hypothetical protein